MNNQDNNNLESKIYKLSFDLSQSLSENEINKLLGVLASDGVYAMWVYAMDKFNNKKNKIEVLIEELNEFVNVEMPNNLKGNQHSNTRYNQYFKKLAEDLNKLLFMKELLEKVLVYAIYHRRAMGA